MNSLYLLLGGLALLGLGYFVYGAWLEKVWGATCSRNCGWPLARA